MLTFRRIAGLALAALSGWLLWQGLEGVLMMTSRGSSLAQSVDLLNGWRFVASGIAIIGGLLAATSVRFGAVVALVGTLLFAALAAAFILAGTDSSLWMDEVIGAAGMIVLTGALLFIRRR
ncbi:hypothetical protein [Hyphomonas sp.]|uniref:hypothetical protein n=1 Tax=Hyphomonas sp. TaxID=87 RepID=UPI001BCBCCBA|nr:hypothetical protein [Hyphomonas sp.]